MIPCSSTALVSRETVPVNSRARRLKHVPGVVAVHFGSRSKHVGHRLVAGKMEIRNTPLHHASFRGKVERIVPTQGLEGSRMSTEDGRGEERGEKG